MCVFPKVESIFSAKSFSLENLSLLTNFQKLFTVSNTVSIIAYILVKDVMLVLQQGFPNFLWSCTPSAFR